MSSPSPRPGRTYRYRALRHGAEPASNRRGLSRRNGRRKIPRVRRAARSGADARSTISRRRRSLSGLAKANIIESAGRVLDSHRMLLTVVTAQPARREQVAAVPIANVGGQPVLRARHGQRRARHPRGLHPHRLRAMGPRVLVGISRQPGGNTVAISAETARNRGDAAPALSRRRVFVFLRSGRAGHRIVQERPRRDRARSGARGRWWCCYSRAASLSALVAAIVVPCTLAITFVVMKAAGLTFNMMTLGGLAAGIGLVHRRRDRDDRGDSSRALLRDGARASAVPAALTELSPRR